MLKSEAVTAMPRSGYSRGLRNGYEPELAGRQWLSDTETDDVFLVSFAGLEAQCSEVPLFLKQSEQNLN